MTTSSHSPGDEENALSQPPLSRTVRLAYGREAVQFGELHLPGSPGLVPTVILIHGGFWRAPLALTGAISHAGVVDLEMAWRLNLGSGAAQELLGGSFNDVPERYAAASPAALLPLGIPQVLIHGTEDDRVPFEVSEVYTQAARAAGDPVTLIELKGADHFVLINTYSDAWARTVEALQQLLHLA